MTRLWHMWVKSCSSIFCSPIPLKPTPGYYKDVDDKQVGVYKFNPLNISNIEYLSFNKLVSLKNDREIFVYKIKITQTIEQK